MVIYALVLRKFIFCPGLLPFTAGHRSVQGSRVGILKFQLGPHHLGSRLTAASPSFIADSMQVFSGHKKLKTFEYLVVLTT